RDFPGVALPELMAHCVEPEERAAPGDRPVGVRRRIVGNVGEMPDAKVPRVRTGRFQDLELLERARLAASMRRVREDRQPGAHLCPGYDTKDLPLVSGHLFRAADLAKGAPPFRRSLPDQAIDPVILLLAGALGRIHDLQVIAAAGDDVPARALCDLP